MPTTREETENAAPLVPIVGHQGAYSASTTYQRPGTLVSLAGVTFRSKRKTQGENPISSPDAWEAVGTAPANVPATNEQVLGFAVPVWAGSNPLPTNQAAIGTANRGVFNLLVLPKTSTIKEIFVWNGATVNGNHRAAILDTGQTKAGELTLLWESGSTAAAGENAWQQIGEPNLGAEEAGRRLYIALMNSGTTHTYGSRTEPLTGSALPPATFAVPRLIAAKTMGGFKFETLKESVLEAATKSLIVLARIA